MALFISGIVLALAAAAPAAPSQMVRAQDPQSVVRALQNGGYAAQLGVDKVGDPMITSAVNGTKFQIFFYNCANHRECATVQFHSGYDLTNGSTMEVIIRPSWVSQSCSVTTTSCATSTRRRVR